jgi:hypothetical protein
MTRTQHSPTRPFVATKQQLSENFSGHTPEQRFTSASATQQTQSNAPIIGINRVAAGDFLAIKGTQHTPEKAFTPSTPTPTPPAPSDPPKKP